MFHLVIVENQEDVNLVQVEFKFNPTFLLFSNQVIWSLYGTSIFAIEPCQSKFTIWKVRSNKTFGEFVRFPIEFDLPINLAQIQKQF
jgi:hypothetical protein